MTVNSTTNRVSYAGNGTANPLPVAFPFQMQSDLLVIETDIASGNETIRVLSSNYSITGSTDSNGFYPNGGSVVPVAVLPTTITWTIIRNPAKTQLVQHVDNDPVPAASLDNPLDKLTMISQRLSDRLDLAMTAPDGTTTTSPTSMEIPADWFAGGKLIAYDPVARAPTTQDPSVVQAEDAATRAEFALNLIQTYQLPHSYLNNFFDVIADNTKIAQIRAGTYAGYLDSYWTAAMAQGRGWYFPEGTYPFLAQLAMREGLEMYGVAGGTIINSSSATYALAMQNANGTNEVEGPKLRKFILNFPKGGIQLNSIAGGFTDDITTQAYMMRPAIEEVQLYGANGGIGIQWSKCFDGSVARNKIQSCTTMIDFEGTDLSAIQKNRLIAASVQGITCNNHGTFGSNTNIRENDILSCNGTNGSIVCGDHRVLIEENYIEDFASTINAPISLSGIFSGSVNRNRVECPSCTYWLQVSADAFYQFEAFGNGSSGVPKSANFGTDGTWAVFYNSAEYRTILHGGNTNDKGFPFNSSPRSNSAGEAFNWYPGAPDGVSANNYGATLRAMAVGAGASAWIIPPLSGFSSTIDFSQPSYPQIGTFAVELIAYSNVAGQVLNWQLLDGATPITTSTVTLTTNPKKFTLSGSFAASTGLNLKLWNNDTTHGGNAFVLGVKGSW